MILLANKFNLAPEFLSSNHLNLFMVSAYGYFGFALFAFYFSWKQNPFGKTFSYLGPILDLLFVSAFMQASGGITHGMGVLLIIVVIAQALLNPGYWAIATSFLGCILLIGIQLYDWILYPPTRTSLFPTLILGLTCIGSTLIASRLVKRVESQSLALSTAEQLNSLIVSLMQQGVIIIDQYDNVKLINQKAQQLLNSKMPLQNLSLKLLEDFLPQENYRLEKKSWGKGKQTGHIIFLYDLTEERKRAQILKLASLGQLAANIAHEIRNPLFAVNQSAELLKEGNQYPQNDRLFQILLDNSKRIDTVIKNVSSLSNRMFPRTEALFLIPWLDSFTEDLYFTYADKLKIKKKYAVDSLKVYCDASQLRQILLNICENGIRHSLQKNSIATLKIEVSVSKESQKTLVHIDIIDNGQGLSEETAKHIFEPFYTTEKNGSGLGLFVAKELLELNGGHLSFSKNLPTGCQFRVTLHEN
jgi:two-component system sensor histidine kinase PilS (NtrC family)